MNISDSTAKKKPTVAVIGAGLAGLAAALELSKYDVDLHVIEANDRVGGRTLVRHINGQPVDYGGFIIYPWYGTFHKIAKELGIEQHITPLPKARIYYDTDGAGAFCDDTQFLTPPKSLGVWARALPKLLFTKPTAPNLRAFGNKTVKEYIKTLHLRDEEEYLRALDTSFQGFCYGPIDEFKMAFAAPMIRQVLLYGNVLKSSYFKEGTTVLTDALANKIADQGGVFHLSTAVKEVDKNIVRTDKGDVRADFILFSKTASSIHERLVDVKSQLRYTHFVTATVELEEIPAVNNDSQWGSCFFSPRGKGPKILSAVNLEVLYSKKLRSHVNLNIRMEQPLPKRSLHALIKENLQNHFPKTKVRNIVHVVEWKHAMPIVTERFIMALENRQGKDGYYFAGDFMGSPSMETALASGITAARRCLKDLGLTKSFLPIKFK